MNPLPEFYQRLKLQRGALLWLLLLVLAFSFLGAFSLVILIANAINGVEPWQESTAFKLVSGVTLATAVLYLATVILAFVRRPSLSYLARVIEDRHGELKESLSTAVEIQEQKGGPTNALESALFESVERQTEEINFRTATLPRRMHPLLAIGLVLGAFFLSRMASDSAILLKARYHYADLRAGENTGLLVEPGDVDLPRGADLGVEAEVTRWQLEAFIDYREGDGAVESYPMPLMGESDFAFTFYAVENSFEYRVRTPSLSSTWSKVTVYDPPVIDGIQIDITPPEYTEEEPLAFSQLLDLFAPEGSEVMFQLDVVDGIETWLRIGEEEKAFNGEITLTAEETTEYQFRLKNQEGRVAVTEKYLLEVKPDEPPTVAIIDPGRDTQAELEDIVPLEIYAADDYGLSRMNVELSVSGLPRSPIEVFAAQEDFPLEQSQLPVVELSKLGVEFGDVITYYAQAWDNKEPEPQLSRSEVYFIEVVEDIDGPDKDQPDGGGGGGGEREEDVDLRAIITELKRLTRLAYRVDLETGERRQLGSQELGAGIAQAATEAQGVLGRVGAVLGRIEEGAPYEMFLEAIYRMVDAEELANAGQPGEAIVPMQESMSMLIRLEKYLEALFPPQQQQGGGGGGSQSQSQAQGESEQSEGEGSGMSISEMKEALEEINRLADEQAAMNRRFDRASSQMGESERKELESMQNELGGEVDSLTNELSRLRQGTNVRDALRAAEGQMGQAAGSAGQGDANRASRAGARARQGLSDAAGLLDQRIRTEATAAISGLAQQAEQLSQGQGAAAGDSRGAAGGNASEEDKDRLKAQQNELNANWDKLRQDMERLTGDLGEVFPEAAEALSEVARNSRDQNIDREMSRAANALLYGRFNRAATSQDDAAQGLQNIAGQLDAAAGTLPGLSPSELRQLLERVAQARRELGQRQPGQQGEGQEGEGQQGEGQSGEGQQAQQSGQPGQEGQQGQQGQQGQSGQGQGESQQAGQNAQASGGQSSGESQDPSQSQNDMGGLGDSISQAGRALKDQNLVELGSELNAAKGGDGDGGGTTPAKVLDQTARVLQEYLRREINDQRIRFNREGGPPPEKYRELVEEYFRDLAEEPSQP